jgi:putative acetyltransferase
MNPIEIRAEEAKDWPRVRAMNTASFETSLEADLVDALRKEANPVLSLVADDGTDVLGHILFSPVSLTGQNAAKIAGLGPMAVASPHQRQGIGSLLVRSGLDQCRRIGFGAVVVVGHAAYYPRFGFAPASQFGIRCEFDVPDEVFLALELEPGYLAGRSGTINYHEAFRRF